MLTASESSAYLHRIAEQKIEQYLREGRGPDLSHWKNKPLPLKDDMANVPAHLRMAYRILRNAGYVPEEVALQKNRHTARMLFLIELDKQIEIKQMKKLEFLRVILDTKIEIQLQVDADSPYYSKVVENVSVSGK